MQLTSFIIQKTLWKPNNHSLSFVLMRVIEGLVRMACSVETSVSGAHSGWFHPSVAVVAGTWVSRGGTHHTVLWDREPGLGPLHRLEVFVFLHQLSSQFTIYLPWTVLTFSSFHLWQISDTLGQASLEASYSIIHTTVSIKGSLHVAWHTGLASSYTAT